MRLGQVLMHRLHHAVRVVRPRNRQHGRMGSLYNAFFRAQATGNNDLAVFRQRLADGIQRFLDRRVDEAAGVDDDEIGAGVVRRGDITLGPQLGEDALRVYKCLGTAERNKPDFRAFYRNRLGEEIRGTGSR